MKQNTNGFTIGLAALAIYILTLGAQGPLHAEPLENPVAVFAALDKVTARISKLEVPLNETVRFGALQITPRICYSRRPTEKPKTTSFVEVTETLLNGDSKKLFTGWMFAESPGLNAVEHPVFDVWLTGCVDPERAVNANLAAQNNAQKARSRRKPRRKLRRRRRRIRQ